MRHKLIILFLICHVSVFAQHYVLDSITPTLGHLINFEENTFKFAKTSPAFHRFFGQLDSLYSGKPEKIHIFHIGGSHIQADIYSNKIRTYLQNMNEISIAQRGFVFPYHLAHTNNPTNYRIEAENELWTGYRCSIGKDSIAWGLAGITAAFRAYADTIYVKSNYKNYTQTPYEFDRLRVFYNTEKDDYNLSVMDSSLLVSEMLHPDKMYKEFRFNRNVDSVALRIHIKDSTTLNPEFALMGMEFMKDVPGIEYTSIGVNGASFFYYNRAAYFEEQLKLYKPDLFIISIGTNDAYMPKDKFDALRFKEYYESFIQMILRVNPECAILLTVPNDDYYRRRYQNPNTAVQQKIITDLAQKYQMAIWDFYGIMGGLGSANEWYKNHLMPRDRIHFTYLGYSIKADLFMNALIKAWATSTKRNEEELLNHFKTLDE
ncbi:MAG: GDSL-type esterase/lipase family protein [Gelidibacter sp.]